MVVKGPASRGRGLDMASKYTCGTGEFFRMVAVKGDRPLAQYVPGCRKDHRNALKVSCKKAEEIADDMDEDT